MMPNYRYVKQFIDHDLNNKSKLVFFKLVYLLNFIFDNSIFFDVKAFKKPV